MDAVHRRSFLVIGALAFAGVAVASGAHAQTEDTTTTTSRPTTTTAPPVTAAPSTTTPPTTVRPAATTTTTTKPATTTTVRNGGAPVPPPASGPSQPLDPSLLGGVGPIDLNPTTSSTVGVFGTEDGLSTTTTVVTDNAIDIASSSNGPSGGMLAMAAVVWLASLGGLLVYAEDQRGRQWQHLAR